MLFKTVWLNILTEILSSVFQFNIILFLCKLIPWTYLWCSFTRHNFFTIILPNTPLEIITDNNSIFFNEFIDSCCLVINWKRCHIIWLWGWIVFYLNCFKMSFWLHFLNNWLNNLRLIYFKFGDFLLFFCFLRLLSYFKLAYLRLLFRSFCYFVPYWLTFLEKLSAIALKSSDRNILSWWW